MNETCAHCGKPLHNEPATNGSAVWVDDTGGDVCGWDGGNEPHEVLGRTVVVDEGMSDREFRALFAEDSGVGAIVFPPRTAH